VLMPCRWTVPPSLGAWEDVVRQREGSAMSMMVFLLVGGHGPSD
jgi:hypothetical protein